MEELETNKFWDFSRNIDLEDFDTQRVYRILMNQVRLPVHFGMSSNFDTKALKAERKISK